MTESTIVRENLMTIKDYTPYCGNNLSRYEKGGCNNPRTIYIKGLEQFQCPHCQWLSTFPKDFIIRYKEKWNK